MAGGGYDDLSIEASLGLPAEPTSPRTARRFIREFCAAADLGEDVCETAALLVSELVTNAVLHGKTRATLVATRPGNVLRVSVVDANPQLPDPDRQVTAESESGRGLRIVANVADRWGIETMTDGGKAIWFELNLDAGRAA